MFKSGALLLFGVAATSLAYANRNVHFTGDFESGRFQPNSGQVDAFFISTVPNPQLGKQIIKTGAGGGSPTSNWDTKVITSESVGGKLVTPRNGKYFARSTLYFHKDYSAMPGNSKKNKPRMAITMKQADMKFDYDVEGYTGFSIFLPANLEHETGKKGVNGKNMIMNVSADGAAEMFSLNYWVPSPVAGEGSDLVGHWWVEVNHSATSTDRDKVEKIDLGSVVPDMGKWTDFVIRWRSNPFSKATNPALAGIQNGRSQLYQANKGILQVWKAQGVVDGNGDRPMVLKVNKVNTPVGLVPHKTWKLGHSFRQYKYGWHQHSTDVAGPVWIGFDEIRYGLTARDGTGYSDVLASCTIDCASEWAAPPPNDSPPLLPGESSSSWGAPTPGEIPKPPSEIVIVP